MRRVRGVGLVLVNERRGGVDGFVAGVVGGLVDQSQGVVQQDAVSARAIDLGGTGQHHEVGSAACDVQGVIRQQRHEHRAITAFGDQVKAVVEELAKDGHPAVEGWRQADVGRQVENADGAVVADGEAIQHQAGRQRVCCLCVRATCEDRKRGGWRRQDHISLLRGSQIGWVCCSKDSGLSGFDQHILGLEKAIQASNDDGLGRDLGGGITGHLQSSRDGGRVVGGLVRDQVAGNARLRVKHQTAGLGVGGLHRRSEGGG